MTEWTMWVGTVAISAMFGAIVSAAVVSITAASRRINAVRLARGDAYRQGVIDGRADERACWSYEEGRDG